MSDDAGRTQRREVEELQGRAKQARVDLEAVETEGFSAELDALVQESLSRDTLKATTIGRASWATAI